MSSMLLIILALSMAFTGIVIAIGGSYLGGFNAILDSVYDINALLGAYTREAEGFSAYVLDRSETAYAEYLQRRNQSNGAMDRLSIGFVDAPEQYLLLQAARVSFSSFRDACDETALKLVAGSEYAQSYDRALRIGASIEDYIKSLLQESIIEGQAVYQRNMLRFRALPALFVLSIALSFVLIAVWARWMFRRVISPVNDLIITAGAISQGHYDTPDIAAYADDEIARLARVVNEMKHATARLVDSLAAQRAIESRLHAEAMRRVKMEATMDTLRLSLLQSQINPHFLFNTLNIISRMAQIEAAPRTEDLIRRLASLFRYNLRSADGIVPLESELRIVADYMAIQQIRFGDRIGYEVHCAVDPGAFRIPVFTLQPLIENAVIHGVSPLEEGGRIRVDIQRDAETLVITVSDTGTGMADGLVERLLSGRQAESSHVSGLGLGNVKRRVEGQCAGRMTIESTPGEGTAITLRIPTGPGNATTQGKEAAHDQHPDSGR